MHDPALALASGVELKVIEEMLRHSSITITADTYTSVLPQVARAAAQAPADLVPRWPAVRVEPRSSTTAPELPLHGSAATSSRRPADRLSAGGWWRRGGARRYGTGAGWR